MQVWRGRIVRRIIGHSFFIPREGLIWTLSILITLPGGMFEYHPVSRAGFAHFPLCREWIKKSFHCRIFQYIPCKGLGAYPSALNTQLKAESAIWRQTFLLKHEECVNFNFKATTRGQHWSSGAILPSNERMSVLHSGGNPKSISSALKISFDHRNFLWASP